MQGEQTRFAFGGALHSARDLEALAYGPSYPDAANRREQIAARRGAERSRSDRTEVAVGFSRLQPTERIVLNPLDAERNYEFLGGNAREHIDQLTARRAAVRQDTQLFDAWMRNASDADLISYFDRSKLYGESSAMAWLRQRQGAR